MKLTRTEESLMTAAYFRGNTPCQQRWTACCDQVVTLSLFYTGDITPSDCQHRFATRGYVCGLYDDDGLLLPEISARYSDLIHLIRNHPGLIQGNGDLDLPAFPTYTSCRLTEAGVALIQNMAPRFSRPPDFPSWPNSRVLSETDAGPSDSSD